MARPAISKYTSKWLLLIYVAVVAVLLAHRSLPRAKSAKPDRNVSAQEGEALLRKLLLPEDQLPDGAKLPPSGGLHQLFFGANPQLTSDRAILSRAVPLVMVKSVNPDDVVAALFAVYRERREIGMHAFVFRDAALAQRAPAQFGGKNGIGYRKGAVIVYLWHDGVTNACRHAFDRHIRKALGDSDIVMTQGRP